MPGSDLQPLRGSNEGPEGSKNVGVPWVSLCLPLLLITAILFLSPNYRQPGPDAMRVDSLGGDFLQDWVGGYIAGSAEQSDRERLYDLEYVKSIQHDAQIVGFEWPEKKYFPMVYPPFFYQAMQPATLLSYPVACKLWGLFCGVAISLSAYLFYRFHEPSRGQIGIAVLAALFFFPLIIALTMGQKSTLLLLVLGGTFLLLHHKKPLPAGLVFGLIAVKPHLGIVIGLTMLLKRQWSFAVGALLTVGTLVGISWWHNPRVWSDYFGVVSSMNDYVESGGYQLAQSHSLWGASQLLFAGVVSSLWVKVIAGLVAIVVLFLLWRVMSGAVDLSSRRFACQFSAMTLVTVMLSPHFYTYDLTILLLPCLLLASCFSEVAGQSERSQICVRAVYVLLVALFVLSGLFERLATQTAVQFSIMLLIGVLLFLTFALSNARQHDQEAGIV